MKQQPDGLTYILELAPALQVYVTIKTEEMREVVGVHFNRFENLSNIDK